jgi:type 1 glutamine amidotransferase
LCKIRRIGYGTAWKATKKVRQIGTDRLGRVARRWQGHTPKACAYLFGPWLESRGLRVVISDTLDIFTNKRLMRNFDLIVSIWTMDQNYMHTDLSMLLQKGMLD